MRRTELLRWCTATQLKSQVRAQDKSSCSNIVLSPQYTANVRWGKWRDLPSGCRQAVVALGSLHSLNTQASMGRSMAMVVAVSQPHVLSPGTHTRFFSRLHSKSVAHGSPYSPADNLSSYHVVHLTCFKLLPFFMTKVNIDTILLYNIIENNTKMPHKLTECTLQI